MAKKPPIIPEGLPEELKPRRRFGPTMIVSRRPVDLESLRDVQNQPGDPNDGDVLTWDDTLKKWVAEAPTTGVTDHGALTGLLDDDHTQYVHNTIARTISANHTLTSYTDISEIAVPANPAAGTRRLFTNTVTGELSVRTSAGTTVSLESGSGTSDHGALTGLLDDDHPQYLLLAGRTGTTNNAILSTTGDGTFAGSSAAGGSLILTSSTHATKDRIFFSANSAFDEANTRLGINVAVPLYQIHSVRSSTATTSDIAHAILAQWTPTGDISTNKFNIYSETFVAGTAANNGTVIACYILSSYEGTSASLGTGYVYGGYFQGAVGNTAGGSASRQGNVFGGAFVAQNWSTFTGGVACSNLVGGAFTAACAIDPGGAQTITNMIGGRFRIESTTANHTVTNPIIMEADTSTVGTGTLTNPVAVLIRHWPAGPTYTNAPTQLQLTANTQATAIAIHQLGTTGQNRLVANTTFGANLSPSAKVHIGAGTTAASTAPLKFATGTSMTVAEAGAVEFTTDDLFFTITTGIARKRLLMADPVGGLTSGRVPFVTTNGRLTDDADLTFDGSTLTVLNLTVTGTLTATIDHGSLTGLGDDDHLQYHTDARALTWLGTRSTTDLPEGANLYFTDERAQDAVGGILTDTATVNFTYNDGAGTIEADVIAAGIDHGGLGGLGDDDHTQYTLRAGRTGITNDTILSSDADGSLAGSAASGGSLFLTSSTHATKANIFLGSTPFAVFDEVNSRFGVLDTTPETPFEVNGTDTGTFTDVFGISRSATARITRSVSASSAFTTGTHTEVDIPVGVAFTGFGINVLAAMMTVNPANASNHTGTLQGISMLTSHRGTGTVTSMVSGTFQARNSSSGTITDLWGINGFVQNSSTGTVTRATSLDILQPVGSATGATWGNIYGVRVRNQNPSSGSNTLTNPPIALLIDNQTATDAVAIYQDGTGGYNKFEGNSALGWDGVPTAKAHLGAGTTAASSAPIKLTSGTSMTAAEAGAIEFTTDDLFFTITTGAARKRLLLAEPVGGLTSGRVPFATTNGRLTDDADLTFDGSTLTVLNLTVTGTTSGIDHGALGGLSDDDHSQYTLKAGRTGATNDTILSTSADGTLAGSSASGGSLLLTSSTHATKDRIFFGTLSAYDEALSRLGLGTTSPAALLHVNYPSTDTAAETVAIISGLWTPSGTVTALKRCSVVAALMDGAQQLNSGGLLVGWDVASQFSSTNGSLSTGVVIGHRSVGRVGLFSSGSASRIDNIYGGYFNAQNFSTFTGGVAATLIVGGLFSVDHFSSPGAAQTVTTSNAGRFAAYNDSANRTLTALDLLYVTPVDVTAGTVGTGIGCHIIGWVSGPTYTNAPEQLRLATMSIANSIGIRQMGSTPHNRFEGHCTIGSDAAPTTDALLDLVSTDAALLVPRMTSAQRDAITAANGMVLYNTTNERTEVRNNGNWHGAGYRTTRTTGSTTSSSTTPTSITGLAFTVVSGRTYYYRFVIVWRTDTAAVGPRFTITFPAVTTQASHIVINGLAADGSDAQFSGSVTASADAVISTAVVATATNYLAIIEGTITPSANGALQAQVGIETGSAAVIDVRTNSIGIIWEIP